MSNISLKLWSEIKHPGVKLNIFVCGFCEKSLNSPFYEKYSFERAEEESVRTSYFSLKSILLTDQEYSI